MCLQAGAAGAQPSNYLVGDSTRPGKILPASVVKGVFEGVSNQSGSLIQPDGFSGHCLAWVLLAAWTLTKTLRPFVPTDILHKGVEGIEVWAEDQLIQLIDLSAECDIKVLPLFWGPAYGYEVASGYPFGFWKGGSGELEYDLPKEGDERFLTKTAKVRDHAKKVGMKLAHEIHKNSAAATANEFHHLRKICGDSDTDPTMVVIADPSHGWDQEDFFARFRSVGRLVYSAHAKFIMTRPGPMAEAEPSWRKRAQYLGPLDANPLWMRQYVELLHDVGYVQRWLSLHPKRKTAPLVCEAEYEYDDGDRTTMDGIRFIKEKLLFVPGGSFEDGIGAK